MILRISFFLLLLVLLPPFYIDRHFQLKGYRRWSLWAVAALFVAFTALFSLHETFSAAEVKWKGIYLFVLLSVSFAEVLFCLVSMAGLLFQKKLKRIFDTVGFCLSLFLLGCISYGFFFGAEQLKKTDFTYTSIKLPASFSGYRIVQLSDLHLGTFVGRNGIVERLVDSVNAQKADLIVFTGDLVNYRSDELTSFLPQLSRLKARDGVVAVLGNHDYAQYVKWPSLQAQQGDVANLVRLERCMGWKVLLNENVVLRRGADSIAIVGVQNDGRPPFPALGNLPMAQRGLSDACFKVLLSHDPTHWRRKVLPDTHIDLTLSGHTHGMQLKIGSFSPARWFYPEWGGAYYSGKRALFVSLGFGEVLFPFRLGAWPEINRITLLKN